MQALVVDDPNLAIDEEHGEVAPVDDDGTPATGHELIHPTRNPNRHASSVTVVRPPSVDALARELADTGLPHPLLVDAARAAIAAGDPSSARQRADDVARTLLRPVINATGVLLHTNLGRAPMALDHPARPTSLELDLHSGGRGSRNRGAGALIARACGAEAALVVNNGAAAVLLVLGALAAGRDVIVSRGELVEIGGGFRIPEVLAQSGCRLVEVGTTNRTTLADYQTALQRSGDDAVVLKVHQSNYRIVGFVASVGIAALASLGAPVVADIGSGLLDASTPWLPGPPPRWLAGEPAARQTLKEGAAVVTFSGDKLLGGPQAGIIAGDDDVVSRCARHPLARALRPGAHVLAALQSTALAYLRGDGMAIPFWRMAAATTDELRGRAEAIGGGAIVASEAVPGGGSAPGVTIPSVAIALDGDRVAALRSLDPPVIARVDGHRTLLDLRSVDPGDDPVLAKAIAAVT